MPAKLANSLTRVQGTSRKSIFTRASFGTIVLGPVKK